MATMLVLLKNKQHKIASVTLSMFMGSWLLILCQNCLAAVNDINGQNKPASEISHSCHELDLDIDDPRDKKNNVKNEHCLGVCDCDDLSVTINNEINSDLMEKIKFSPDLYTYYVPQITISNRAPPSYQILTMPERAILLPLQHYTVLLI